MGLETDLAKLVEEQPAGPGIKCLLYKNANNPTVAVHGSILAGTSSEPSGKSGLAGSQVLQNLPHVSSSEEPGNSEPARSQISLNPWEPRFLSEILRTASSSKPE